MVSSPLAMLHRRGVTLTDFSSITVDRSQPDCFMPGPIGGTFGDIRRINQSYWVLGSGVHGGSTVRHDTTV